MTFGYDADVVKVRGPASSNQIADNAKSLAYALLHLRQQQRQISRPVIFITHSLGGIVCENALLLCDQRENLQSILASTVGVIFMGTPHHGASVARWGHNLAQYLGIFKTANSDLVGSLKLGNSQLGHIAEDFQHLLMRADVRVKIFCFYETLPVPYVGIVVEQFSAVLSAYDSLPLDANHQDMAKFNNRQNAGYRKIHGVLTRWFQDLRHNELQPDETIEPIPTAHGSRGDIIFNGQITGHNVVTGLHQQGGVFNLTFS
jgi:protein SERAC1